MWLILRNIPTSYQARLHPSALTIFLFHGVIRENRHGVRNYTFKHILAHDFQRIIQGLADCGTPLDVEQVVQCHDNGKPYPPRSFLVSFDDGFENNFSVASTILYDLGVPAVF